MQKTVSSRYLAVVCVSLTPGKLEERKDRVLQDQGVMLMQHRVCFTEPPVRYAAGCIHFRSDSLTLRPCERTMEQHPVTDVIRVTCIKQLVMTATRKLLMSLQPTRAPRATPARAVSYLYCNSTLILYDCYYNTSNYDTWS